MIEEYKLDDSLAPYYEVPAVPVGPTRPSPAGPSAGFHRFPSSSSSAKPTLRTVSIIDTLSELTGASVSSNRSAMKNDCAISIEQPVHVKSKFPAEGAAAARRKKGPVLPAAEPHAVRWPSKQLLQQPDKLTDYPRKLDRSLEVPRLGVKAGMARKGRSVEDVLRADPLVSKTGESANVHGYGSLERRRRRRPGARTAASLARRGETDWEREEDEEEESFSALFVAPSQAPKIGTAKVLERNKEGAVGMACKPRQRSRNLGPKERGQTPDWIHKIFDVARRGNLANLQRAVSGMEVTLVRNLSDHRGNNLLHVVAAAGKADVLSWLCSAYGIEMQSALFDENKRGLTPIVAAIQAGRLEALQFLVEHTSARDRIAPIDGDRALLHIAAKYGKVEIVAWLSQYMVSHGYEVDLRDHCGHTPLHLAARAGNASAVAILVAHGADVSAKNDMGHRPLDLASAYGHVGVAQLLRLHDAALGLATETLEFNQALDYLRGDYAELKSYFRDVLTVAKRLAKERDEMCRQLGRLYEDVTSLHQGLLLELRALHREAAGSRDRMNGSKKSTDAADLDDSVAAVETLHERWQNQQRSWFSSSLADMEHRLLVAEDGWKRLRNSHAKHRQCQIQPHELLRSRLAAINAQSNCQQCDVAILSSSEGSLYSAGYEDGSSTELGDEDDPSELACQSCFSPSAPAAPVTSSLAPANVIPKKPANLKPFSSTSVDVTIETASVYSTRSVHKPPAAATVSVVAAEVEVSPFDNEKRRASKLEIRKKLHEFKLTSESGNASVIEVIEPSSSDGEDEPDCSIGGQPQDQSTPKRSIPYARSFNASFSDELAKARLVKTFRPAPGDKTSAANSKIVFPEPDLLAGTVYRDATEVTENDPDFEADYDHIAATNSTRSGSSLSNPASAGRKKARFLTKFALKARWPTKKKAAAETAPTSTSSDSPELMTTDEAAVRSSPEEVSTGAEAENSVSSGVVAGLSQMFEDMSKSTKPVFSTAGGAAENKRGPSRNSAASGSSEVSENTRAKRELQQKECDETTPPPPPASSPPLESDPSSHETTLRAHPPPPPRLSSHLTKSSGDLSKVSSAVTPSSSASSSTSASHGGAESLSVAASEDSGIVIARPASSASKSDSLPRPAAPNYSFAAFKGFPLRKASSVSGEILQQESSITSGDRLSPSPSDLSKTESGLSPPSHASDLSKTESMRHFRQLARIEETAVNNSNTPPASTPPTTDGLREEKSEIATHGPKKNEVTGLVEMATQSGQILTWREAKLKNQVVTPPPLEERLMKARVRLDDKGMRTLKKRQVAERPWYDVSDDESDLLSPERLTSLKTSRSSSEEDIEV